MRLQIGISNNYLFLLGPFNVLEQGQSPIRESGPMSLQILLYLTSKYELSDL